MKIVLKNKNVSLLALACALSLGCESPPKTVAPSKIVVKQKEAKPVSPPVVAPIETAPAAAVSTDVQVLKDGTDLYNNGDYNGAIKKLSNSTEIWNGHNKTIQVSALKTMAFCYCVTSRTKLCRQQFQRALKLDPAFSLLPSEIGHPIWGPVFLKAKKNK
ncbi:MAG: TssQ family T6SS-associated lipoprotein [Undibacterium sp.]|nr:TssQ family T6SS-associated lipoprotein [Undibacterium sp.]